MCVRVHVCVHACVCVHMSVLHACVYFGYVYEVCVWKGRGLESFSVYIKISWQVSKLANTAPRDCYGVVQEYQHFTKGLLRCSSGVPTLYQGTVTV